MQRIVIILIVFAGLWWFWPDASTDWPLKNAPSTLKSVITFGDSLTSGKGASDGMTYPEQFAKITGIKVENKGKSGDTTTSALARIGQVTKLKADAVFITLIGNDMMRQHGLKRASQNLTKIFQTLTSKGFLVVYLNIDPPFINSKWRERMLEVCKEQGVLWVDRVMDGFWLNSSKMHDQIHPNDAGYKIMAERVVKALKDRKLLF